MKLLLVLLILVEVALLILLFSPVLVDSREKARLVVELHDHPTLEAEARLRAIGAKESREDMLFRLLILGSIAADGFGIFLVSRRLRR